MSEPADDSELRRHVERFATEVGDLVAGVVPDESPPFDVVVVPGAPTHVLVRQQPEEGVALSVGGEVLLLLQASYRCTWDTVGAYLAVRASSFVVRARAAQEPLFRYDYVADADDNVPVAHLNVHGHRDELVFAMMSAGRRLRGRSRAASVARGQVPRLSTFHFPVRRAPLPALARRRARDRRPRVRCRRT